jgi:hypothetical protein
VRLVVAILIGLAILGVGFATLRGLAGPRRGTGPAPLEVVRPVPDGLRILYWCETCGTEVLLVRQGSDAAPRHCGEPMTRREEIPRGP